MNHSHDTPEFTHQHVFHGGNAKAEQGTRIVMWITLVTMVIEITAGWWYGSMALLADGWHMSSHAVAIGLTALSYRAARRLADDQAFAFGTWKIEVLGGFASAVFLLGVAGLMAYESVTRLLEPHEIQYQQSITIAVFGLLVNLVCAYILGESHHHDHGDHAHGHHHDDLNLKSAYIHVIADAATSVLAIIALFGGWLYGWSWLDPAMGIVGAVLIASWARNLIAETGKVLLDREMDHPVVDEIREVIAAQHDVDIADLHVWRIGRQAYACAMSLVTHDNRLTPAQVREWLSVHEEIVHATIEIQVCAEGVVAQDLSSVPPKRD